MRKDELLLELLREMAGSADGRMMLGRTIGMDEGEQERCHHMELLDDAGLADWNGEQLPRITNAGYDFIEAADKNLKVMDTFKEKLKEGVPLLQAVSSALSLMT